MKKKINKKTEEAFIIEDILKDHKVCKATIPDLEHIPPAPAPAQAPQQKKAEDAV